MTNQKRSTDEATMSFLDMTTEYFEAREREVRAEVAAGRRCPICLDVLNDGGCEAMCRPTREDSGEPPVVSPFQPDPLRPLNPATLLLLADIFGPGVFDPPQDQDEIEAIRDAIFGGR